MSRRRRIADEIARDEEPGNEAASESARPSRTEQTRAAAAVNRLGLALTRLSVQDLDRLELPERIREEVELSQRLKPRERGRQNRLIGQLLRAEDHAAIEDRLGTLQHTRREGVHHERVTERWCDRIIAEGDPAIDALVADHPDADRQRIRQLMRNARQDPAESRAKKARRELLRAIRALRG